MKFVKHFKSSFFTALLECRPGKRVDDGVDAGGLVVSICNSSCCSALKFFYRFTCMSLFSTIYLLVSICWTFLMFI